MDINVLAGKHIVKGEFGETLLRLFSDFISLFSILGLVIYLIYGLIHKFRKI
jgi:flagellar biogenesis protein FliO